MHPRGYLNDASGPVGWEWKSFKTAENSCAASAPDAFGGPVNEGDSQKVIDLRPPSITATDIQCASQSRVCASAYLCVPNRCTDVDRDGAFLCPANQCLNSSQNPTLAFPIWRQRNTCKTQDCDDTDPDVFPGMIPRGTDIVYAFATIDPDYIKLQQQKNKFTPTTSNVFTILKVTVNIKPCVYGPPAFAADIAVVLGDGVISVGTFTFTQLFEGSNTYTTSMSLGGFWYTNLEKVIAHIGIDGRKNPVTFRITPLTRKPTGFKDFSYVMTNCMQTYGSGVHKVVYMRDKATHYRTEIKWSDLAISGFKSVEPIKKYQDTFSHFVDLKKVPFLFSEINSNNLPILRIASSCGYWNKMYFGTYLDPKAADGWGNGFTVRGSGVVIIENSGFDGNLEPYKYVHELGHAMAVLADEYVTNFVHLSTDFPSSMIEMFKPHCTTDPATDFSSRGVLYGGRVSDGGKTFAGCKYYNLNSLNNTPQVFRPSAISIMRSGGFDYPKLPNPQHYQFNVISCAHLLKAIKNTASWKENLSECAAMPGIIPVGQ